MSWSNNFRSKEELKRDQWKRELAEWAEKIQAEESEIMAGAPGKDQVGVKALKNQLEASYREKAKLERKLARLEETGK